MPLFKNIVYSMISFQLMLSNVSYANNSVEQIARHLEEWSDKVSSSGVMNPSELQIIMNNEAALEGKIDILRQAHADDRVYMMYYIHANDESTSRINFEIIEAAKRGAKVNILVDYLTNYTRLDMFNMLARQSHGNLNVLFFNPPTASIHRDVLYLTSDCLKNRSDCHNEKALYVNKVSANGSQLIGNGNIFSKMFLAGLSAKKPDAIKLGLESGGTLPKPTSDKPLSADDKKSLKELLQLVFGAKILANTADKIKLAIAGLLYEEEIKPILTALDNMFPLGMKNETPSGKDWEEISQFLHHKLCLLVKANGQSLIVQKGGRNLENSYHLNEWLRVLVAKYLFFDTDVKYRVNNPAQVAKMETGVKALFGYKDMVASLSYINKHLPVDYALETETIKKVLENPELKLIKESGAVGMQRYAEIVEQQVGVALQGKALSREAAQYEKMIKGIERYNEMAAQLRGTKVSYLPEIFETLDQNDRNAKVAYFENLPFQKNPKLAGIWCQYFSSCKEEPQQVRVYNPEPNQEVKSNKNIHGLWREWLTAEARKAKLENKDREIIIHQGYFFMPSGLVSLIGQMLDGTIDASRLHLQILTNSIETTDLSPINVYARHQMKAIFEFYAFQKNKMKNAKALKSLQIYEFKKLPDGKISSAHSKGIFSPENMFIGSANADVRSYETDTNNGLFIMNAPHTAGKMMTHIKKSLLSNPDLVMETTSYYNKRHSELLAEDGLIVQQIASKYKGLGKRISSNMPDVQMTLIQHLTDIYVMMGVILDGKSAHVWLGSTSKVESPKFDNSKPAWYEGNDQYLNPAHQIKRKINLMRLKTPEQIRLDFDRMLQTI